METAPLSTLVGQPLTPANASNPAIELKTDFLRLLIAQMQNQDPLNPQDPTEFTAQLAQFSSLEQLVNMNQMLAEQAELQTTAIGTAAVSFVGQEAEVLGDLVHVDDGQVGGARFTMPVASSETQLNIYDSSDSLLRSMTLGPLEAGQHDISEFWDASNDAGSVSPDGDYRFEVVALDAEGGGVPVRYSTIGTISGIRFESGMVLLQIGEEFFTFGDLLAVGEHV